MSRPRKIDEAASIRELRAKAELYDELVEELARAEDELERLKASRSERDGIDPAWREIANDLAGALRPYSLFRDMVVRDGRIVVETSVPGSTLGAARRALDRLGEQVARESFRRDRMAPDWRTSLVGQDDGREEQAA